MITWKKHNHGGGNIFHHAWEDGKHIGHVIKSIRGVYVAVINGKEDEAATLPAAKKKAEAMAAKAKEMTPQDRANAIVEKFRGMDQEFYMLKAILIMSFGPEEVAKQRGGVNAEIKESEARRNYVDTAIIAERMDQINNEAREAYRQSKSAEGATK